MNNNMSTLIEHLIADQIQRGNLIVHDGLIYDASKFNLACLGGISTAGLIPFATIAHANSGACITEVVVAWSYVRLDNNAQLMSVPGNVTIEGSGLNAKSNMYPFAGTSDKDSFNDKPVQIIPVKDGLAPKADVYKVVSADKVEYVPGGLDNVFTAISLYFAGNPGEDKAESIGPRQAIRAAIVEGQSGTYGVGKYAVNVDSIQGGLAGVIDPTARAVMLSISLCSGHKDKNNPSKQYTSTMRVFDAVATVCMIVPSQAVNFGAVVKNSRPLAAMLKTKPVAEAPVVKSAAAPVASLPAFWGKGVFKYWLNKMRFLMGLAIASGDVQAQAKVKSFVDAGEEAFTGAVWAKTFVEANVAVWEQAKAMVEAKAGTSAPVTAAPVVSDEPVTTRLVMPSKATKPAPVAAVEADEPVTTRLVMPSKAAPVEAVSAAPKVVVSKVDALAQLEATVSTAVDDDLGDW